MSVDVRAFRRTRAGELERMGEVLVSEALVVDPSPLYNASSLCRSSGSGGSGSWGYRIDELRFVLLPSSALAHACPHDVQDVSLFLSLDVEGECIESDEQSDPFSLLAVDAHIIGYAEHNNDLRTISCSWHLDRHITAPGSNEPEFAHPHYHFQYGGRRAWALSDFGQQMLLEAPRLAHPPLDGILAIDFVLSNYFGQRWRTIRDENTEYERLVMKAQNRCWRAYAAATASAWASHRLPSTWPAHLLWPQMWQRPYHSQL